jgi:vancomycin resistance protein VanW
MSHQRKLFCEISPLCYKISVAKCCFLRRLRDFFSSERFCCHRSEQLLPQVICKHKSLIRRQLGNVDMTLQENKAVNLSLAAPAISGILIRPGETFSLWRLVGKTSARRGFREGLMIKGGKPDRGIGGGLCQLSNLIHWIVLHTPFEITEHHHHDGVDLFPDFGRQVPFGVGTSISYNYLDYRFRNTTDMSFQLLVYTDARYLNAELRSDQSLPVKYHIESRNERFEKEKGIWFRKGEVWRQCFDKATGNCLEEKQIKINHARVMYDEKYITRQSDF